jgi:hypothetical protein
VCHHVELPEPEERQRFFQVTSMEFSAPAGLNIQGTDFDKMIHGTSSSRQDGFDPFSHPVSCKYCATDSDA